MMENAAVAQMMRGRIRLKFLERRDDVEFFENLVELLSAQPLVDEVVARPSSASVVVRHRATQEEVLALARAFGISADPLQHPAPRHREPHVRVPKTHDPASTGRAGPLLPAALALLGGTQVLRGNALGPASEHLWHARILAEDQSALALLSAVFAVVQIARGEWLSSAASLFLYSLTLGAGASEKEQAATAEQSVVRS